MLSTSKIVYYKRLTAMEDFVKFGRHVGVALLLGILTITAAFAEEAKAPSKSSEAARAKGQPAKAGGDRPRAVSGGRDDAGAINVRDAGAGGPPPTADKSIPTDKGGPSGSPKGTNMAAPASGGQNQTGKASPTSATVPSKQGGTNTSPIDLSGGLPRSKDRSKELHQKVQEMAKQVLDLGKKAANSARTPSQVQNRVQAAATAIPAGSVTRNVTGSLNAAGKPMFGGSQIPNPGAPARLGLSRATATGVPGVVNAANASQPPAGHSLNAAAITGTGIVHSGVGPGTVGGAAKAVVGVNGSTIRAKR